MKRLHLKGGEERRLLRGHLWVYRNELADAPEVDEGELVDIYAPRGRFVGRGFYQRQGGIAARILTLHQEEIDASFVARRLDEALAFRRRLFRQEMVYRWVFGESDGLPGFVADRYGPVVAAHSPCGFYRTIKDELARSILAHDGVDGVLLVIGGESFVFGNAPDSVDCILNGLNVRVDLTGGQKTGLFLDQRCNWRTIEPFAREARVLDGHCYVGLWSLHAARAGAASVLGVDTSEPALDRARQNAQMNGLDNACQFVCADIMGMLEQGEKYDVIVLDPPALAKSRAQENHALALHQRMNKAALAALNPGGVLATSSCSHFVSREHFLEILKRAAVSAQRKAWILGIYGPAPDHPLLTAMPETVYLNCVLMRVML